MSSNETKVKHFQRAMVAYWHENGRHNLPWRQTTNAWRILLAEILLRKTTSAQVVAVYQHINSFSPADILTIDETKLGDILKPLGIHRVRARQMKLTAQAVIDTDGKILESDEMLRNLPGIGRYISNSVRCCAFNTAAPAMDSNLIRIMARVFGWVSQRKRPRDDNRLWQLAETLVPLESPREFNWGMLDFASAICTHRRPKCEICPISSICNYYAAAQQSAAVENPI